MSAGGSVRSPAANNGVWSLRPSSFRIPFTGTAVPGMDGAEQIIPVLGPLSTSLEGIKLFMRTVTAAQPWRMDSSLLPLPWRDGESHLKHTDGRKRLRVGILRSDGVVKPQPPITRAINEVVSKLKAVDKVEVVEWQPWKHDHAWDIIVSCLMNF